MQILHVGIFFFFFMNSNSYVLKFIHHGQSRVSHMLPSKKEKNNEYIFHS